MSENVALSLLFAGVGVLFILLSIPLILKKIPPNYFYGVRTRRTLSDENLWYVVNHHFGKSFLIGGVCIFVAASALAAAGSKLDPAIIALILILVTIGSLAFAILRCRKTCRLL